MRGLCQAAWGDWLQGKVTNLHWRTWGTSLASIRVRGQSSQQVPGSPEALGAPPTPRGPQGTRQEVSADCIAPGLHPLPSACGHRRNAGLCQALTGSLAALGSHMEAPKLTCDKGPRADCVSKSAEPGGDRRPRPTGLCLAFPWHMGLNLKFAEKVTGAQCLDWR